MPYRARRIGTRVALTMALSMTLTTCTPARSTLPSLRGQHLDVVAVWSGTEQERFEGVLRGFEEETGATVTYTSSLHRIGDYLAERRAAGSVPDVAFLPQPGLLRQYAREGFIVPVGETATAAVRRNYAGVWQQLAEVDGRLYGVWFKAADKSLIWYNVGAFERAGVVPPDDVAGLLAASQSIAASGLPALSVGGADGWTLTDWFENLYLRQAGQAAYDALAEHRLPWTDQSVKKTLGLLRQVLAPNVVAGGAQGALKTGYEGSVTSTFAQPAGAAMVFEGDFVAGVITGTTKARLGIDADAFAFPRVGDEQPTVVGGGDAAVLLHPSPAGYALLAYLATPAAAARWAAKGGFISPNRNLDLAVYPDDITRTIARSLLEARDDFRFDLSDLQPAAFGSAADRGMRKRLQQFLLTGDVDGTAAGLEADAKAAWG